MHETSRTRTGRVIRLMFHIQCCFTRVVNTTNYAENILCIYLDGILQGPRVVFLRRTISHDRLRRNTTVECVLSELDNGSVICDDSQPSVQVANGSTVLLDGVDALVNNLCNKSRCTKIFALPHQRRLCELGFN